jgi:hypothetical protein
MFATNPHRTKEKLPLIQGNDRRYTEQSLQGIGDLK